MEGDRQPAGRLAFTIEVCGPPCTEPVRARRHGGEASEQHRPILRKNPRNSVTHTLKLLRHRSRWAFVTRQCRRRHRGAVVAARAPRKYTENTPRPAPPHHALLRRDFQTALVRPKPLFELGSEGSNWCGCGPSRSDCQPRGFYSHCQSLALPLR